MSNQKEKSAKQCDAMSDTKSELDESLDVPPPYELHSSGTVLASSAAVNGRQSIAADTQLESLLTATKRTWILGYYVLVYGPGRGQPSLASSEATSA